MQFLLKTAHLFLREMTPDDFPFLCTMLQDPNVMYAWEKIFSDAEVRAWIERNIVRYQQFGYGYWLAFERKTGEFVGQIGLIPEEIKGKRHTGIGWILCRKHWKKGYATEGARACLNHAFQHLKIDRIIADIRPSNATSIRVAEHLNMFFCGEYDKFVDEKTMPHRLYYAKTPFITIMDFQEQWAVDFQKLKKLLRPILERFGGQLEHVGSTSVPELPAKPVIDADYIPADIQYWPMIKISLETLGFHHRGNGGLPGREMFTESLNLDFRHNFYVCSPDSPHLVNHLKVRDFLKAHSAERQRYGELKKELAGKYPDDIDSYCAGKSDLLSEFLIRIGFDEKKVREINLINKSFVCPAK